MVVLVLSSVSGARQWNKLIEQLSANFSVLAPNLFGFSNTLAWCGQTNQPLSDQADLILKLFLHVKGKVCLVGHSFGASVAMKAATALKGRVDKLILIEPNNFFLLRDSGRMEALQNLFYLRDLGPSHRSPDPRDCETATRGFTLVVC